VHDALTGARIVEFSAIRGVQELAFSRDGKWLMTARGTDVQGWLWNSRDLVTEVCARVDRNLTSQEWDRYLGTEPYRLTCPDLARER
jgi:hypothetical protein